ncbi:MAG TPA: flavodoxin domain-containing protein [Chitinophagaceae bacterium]|nr:flavodoxin domain-containing protein [Chitinophagaceae bacterium]
MLVENKLNALQKLIDSLTDEELVWVNGYLNGIVTAKNISEKVPQINATTKITIVYGTETGNSKKLATEFAAKAKKHGIHAKVQSMDQYRLNDLAREEYFLVIMSTHGDGEPPAAAKKFYNHIHNNGFRLDKLKYGVLALGDTSYPLFCKAGEDVDEQLNHLGGERLHPLQKCDVDYEADAVNWFDSICKILNHTSPGSPGIVTAIPAVKKTGSRTLHNGKVLAHINLNDHGSNKETYHIELEAIDAIYAPGDSIGIVPENNRQVVKEIISRSGIDENTTLHHKDELYTVAELLHKKLNIVYLPERVVKKYASICGIEFDHRRYDLIELLMKYPLRDKSQFIEVIKVLEPIAPRLYSIASSPEAHPGEVHITVAKNTFTVNNEKKSGLASGFLSAFETGESLQYYIHPNYCFRLPEPDKNIILIGPGTGIAPFRAFIAERDATGASGKTWLFFGEQHFVTDFLYQSEIQNWFETGALTRVTTAFSRDQQEKIYVQHKMLQQGAEFFEWLETGAYVYVCGAKEPMSIDVEKMILHIIEKFGDRTEPEASKYLDNLKEDGRYITDVY